MHGYPTRPNAAPRQPICAAICGDWVCTLNGGHGGDHSAGGPDRGDGTCFELYRWPQ